MERLSSLLRLFMHAQMSKGLLKLSKKYSHQCVILVADAVDD